MSRPSGFLVLWGVLLTACGPTLEPERVRAPEDALGHLESTLCAGSSVSSLGLTGVNTYQGVMAGSGNWAVTAPANGALLEYYIDNVRQSVDVRPGTSGTWYFSVANVTCGSHTFEVKAYPMVIDSAGNQTTCESSGPRSLIQVVSEACPSVCGDGVCSGRETRINGPRDCCDSGVCRNGSCCPTTGRCSDGLACML